MWTSSDFKIEKKEYDFSSSEGGKPTFSVLKIDDIEFINMVEQIDIDEETQIFQSKICVFCGTESCGSGNWVAIRQFNEYIIFIPTFEEIKEDPDVGEYDPPFFLRKHGAFYTDINAFNNLVELVPEFKKLKEIKKISKTEIIDLYKWDTPQNMFGDFGEDSSLKTSRIAATSILDIDSVVQIIEKALRDLEKLKNINLKLVTNDEIISIYLDDKYVTEWKALSRSGDEYCLLLGGVFKLVIDG